MSYVIQRAVLPNKDVGAPSELYFRTGDNARCVSDRAGKIILLHVAGSPLNWVSFDTFFGAFSATNWFEKAGVTSFRIEFNIKGRALFRVWRFDGRSDRKLLHQEIITASESVRWSTAMDLDEGHGIIYPDFHVLEGEVELSDLDYSTDQPPARPVRLTVIMPTFKREKYIERNIRLLAPILGKDDGPTIQVQVVDNGSSLKLPPSEAVRIVRNPNLGGSGGFARGLFEVSQYSVASTHVLFCDDDLILEPESVLRVAWLASYLREDSIIPGGMMELGSPGNLHEVGARVKGFNFTSVKGGLDLRQVPALIEYERPENATFFGWWFVLFPMGTLENLYPAPYFVGWDDVLYGKMLDARPKVAALGIAVWHEEFSRKDVNWRWYYHSRNGFATNAMFGKLPVRHHTRHVLHALLTYRYERAEFLLRGADDVLMGPGFLAGLDMENFHVRLSAESRSRLQKLDRARIGPAGPEKNRALRRLISRLSLNGHLLPDVFFRSEDPAVFKTIRPLHSFETEPIFLRRTVVYLDEHGGLGIVCRLDRGRFFRLLARLIKQFVVLKLREKELIGEWQKASETLTSKSSWSERFARHRS